MDEPLRRLISAFLSSADTLADGLAAGQITPAQWERGMGRLVVESHLASYFVGRNTDELSPEADRVLGRLMQEQLDYLRGFADSLEGMSEAQVRARAALYGGALKATHSRAQHWGWPLPFFPSEGTPCGSNCRCSWEVAVEDEEEQDATAYWRMGATEHCGGCSQRAAANPYRIRGGVLQ